MTQTLPPRSGLSAPIVTSIPQKWNPEWFRTFITYFLQLGKIIQNGITSGAGISITVAPGGQQQINLQSQPGDSVLGVTGSATGTPAAIIATADGQVLQRSGGAVIFAPISGGIASGSVQGLTVNSQSSTGANTIIIQSALNSAASQNQLQVAITNAGIVYTNTIYIPDGVTLYIGPQTILMGGPSNSHPVVKTSAFLNSEFAISSIAYSSVTNLCTVTTAGTLASLGISTGSWVAIYYVYPDGYPGVFQVTATGASTFTYTPIVKPSATSATLATISNPNGVVANITGRVAQRFARIVNDGIIDWGTSAFGTGASINSVVWLGYCDVARVYGGQISSGIRMMFFNCVNRPYFGDCTALTTQSADGLHVNGPVYSGVAERIKFIGESQEASGIGGADYSTDSFSAGAIHAFSIKDCNLENCGAGHQFFGGRPAVGNTVDWKTNCSIERSIGSVTAGPVVKALDDPGDINTTHANFGAIIVKDIQQLKSASSQPAAIALGASTIDRFMIENSTDSPYVVAENFIALTGNIDIVELRNCHSINAVNGAASGAMIRVTAGLTPTTRGITINLEGCYCDGTVSSMISANPTASTPIDFNFIGCNFSPDTIVTHNGAGPININATGSRLSPATYIARLQNAGNLNLNFNTCVIGTGFIGLEAVSTGNIVVSGAGSVWTAPTLYTQAGFTGSITFNADGQFPSPGIVFQGGFTAGAARIQSYDVPVDVTNAGLSTSFFPQWAQSTTAGAGKQGLANKVNNAAVNTWYALATGAGGVNTLIV